MSILPAVTIPPDYQAPSAPDSTWAVGQSRKAVKLMGGPPEADGTLKLVGIGADAYAYAEGSSQTPPLEADRIAQIKNELYSMSTEGFKSLAAIRIIAQTVSVVQAYTGLYNLLAQAPIASIVPYNLLLSPLSSFYLKGEVLIDDIEAWQKAQGTEKENDCLIKVMGSTANTLIYGAQVVAFLAMTKVHVSLQVFLSTILYSSSIYDVLSTENNGATNAKNKIETPLEISMMV